MYSYKIHILYVKYCIHIKIVTTSYIIKYKKYYNLQNDKFASAIKRPGS